MKTINEKNNFAFEFKPVTKLFEEQVQLHPDQCAVISGGDNRQKSANTKHFLFPFAK